MLHHIDDTRERLMQLFVTDAQQSTLPLVPSSNWVPVSNALTGTFSFYLNLKAQHTRFQDDLLFFERDAVGYELLPDFFKELNNKLPPGNTFDALNEPLIDAQNEIAKALGQTLRETGHMTGPFNCVTLLFASPEINHHLHDDIRRKTDSLHGLLGSSLLAIPPLVEPSNALLFFEELLSELPPLDLFHQDLS